jgi:phage recombination protein Bet
MTVNAIEPVAQGLSLSQILAEQYHVDRKAFLDTVKATCMPSSASTDVDLMVFLMVAHKYNLNPLTREIYAFPRKGDKGGIQVIVGFDGWARILANHDQYDGCEFVNEIIDNKVVSTTCKIFRKGMSRPTCVTEYMVECFRNTEPWKQWPIRMLRHKAYIQAARLAFGISGIQDEDEFDRSVPQSAPRQIERAKVELNLSQVQGGKIEDHTPVTAAQVAPQAAQAPAQAHMQSAIPASAAEQTPAPAPAKRGRPAKPKDEPVAKPGPEDAEGQQILTAPPAATPAPAPVQKPTPPPQAAPAPAPAPAATPSAPPAPVAETSGELIDVDVVLDRVVYLGNDILKLVTVDSENYYSNDMAKVTDAEEKKKARERFEFLAKDRKELHFVYDVDDKGRCRVRQWSMK